MITSGAEATVVASSAPGSAVRVYPVEKLDAEYIFDTNGAGDCFAGGFVGALVSGKSLDDAVKLGHKLGAMCVGQVRTRLFSVTLPRTNNETEQWDCVELDGAHAPVAKGQRMGRLIE